MALNILSIDFDYWYLGLNVEKTFHCGRCVKRTGRPQETDSRFRLPEITQLEVIDLIWPGTPVYVSESHADISLVLDEVASNHNVDIYNIDAHSDLVFESNDSLHCGNWVTYLKEQRKFNFYTHIRSRKDFLKIPKPDVVYICRSSAYLLQTLM